MKENDHIRRSPQILALEEAAVMVEPQVSENRLTGHPGQGRQMTPGGQCLGEPDHLQAFLDLNTVGTLGSENSLLFRAVLCPVRHFITSLASAPWMSVPFSPPLL